MTSPARTNVPPMVINIHTGGPAYLIVWEQEPDRSWWAYLAWIEYTDIGWRGREARVIGADVQEIPGQDYSRVPRRRVDGPQDPYDPRDPYYELRVLVTMGDYTEEPDF